MELMNLQAVARVSGEQWVSMPPGDADVDVLARCNNVTVSEALKHLPGVRVRNVTVNRSGVAHIAASPLGVPGFTAEGLPAYCSVLIEQHGSGGHVSTVDVWVPLVWNGRFLGTAGAGSRLTLGQSPLVVAVRNGFATARTDGGVGDEASVFDWPFNSETKKNDETLITNWAHTSTHDMTVIGKAVTTAIHGREPAYSYFQGSSGGGRQGIASAVHHPSDYDGVLSSMPAINWTRLNPATLWPAMVMKELGNAMPPVKFEVFRQAALTDFNRKEGSDQPFITSVERHSFDPFAVVGTLTEAGAITQDDARVMQLIWDGPRTPDGERLWFGLRPGTESWGALIPSLGLCCTADNGSGLVPTPAPVGVSWFKTWLLEDPDWDWTTMDFDEYFRLFKLGIEKFAHISMDDPDLSGFRDNGSKLLVTHGTDDQVIVPEGSYNYYNRVIEKMGGFAATGDFARFFVCFGEGHGVPVPGRFNHDMATGMTALMRWVESGIEPNELNPVQVGSPDGVSDPSLGVRYGE